MNIYLFMCVCVVYAVSTTTILQCVLDYIQGVLKCTHESDQL